MTEARSDIVSVDNTNFQDYVENTLNPPPSPEEAAAKELIAVEAEKAERLQAEADKKAAEEDPTHDLGETVPKEKKGKLNERFSELTKARKDAEAKAEQALQEAKAAREEREAILRERDELRAKYEPPKIEIGPEPLLEQFADPKEFIKARDEYIADKTRREDAAKAAEESQTRERETLAKSFQARQDAFRKEMPEYDAKIAASDVKVSDQIQAAIIESDVGPQLLVHLAENPDFAAELGKMTVAKALREFGKLEAKLGGTDKPAPQKHLKAVEISKAPPPITPLKGANAPVLTLKGTDPVPSNLTYDDWRALRESGRIK